MRLMPAWLVVLAFVALPVAAESNSRSGEKVIVAKKRFSAKAPRARTVRAAPAVPSFGQLVGLHSTGDALDLKSSVALVLDQDTNEVLFSKNPQAVLPIASITKLMTALVVSEAGRCLVMQAQLSGRKLIMVLLDSAGKYSRIGDAERIRKWLSEMPIAPRMPSAAIEAIAPLV